MHFPAHRRERDGREERGTLPELVPALDLTTTSSEDFYAVMNVAAQGELTRDSDHVGGVGLHGAHPALDLAGLPQRVTVLLALTFQASLHSIGLRAALSTVAVVVAAAFVCNCH